MTKTVPSGEPCDYGVDQEARASNNQAYVAEQCHDCLLFALWVLTTLNQRRSVSVYPGIMKLWDVSTQIFFRRSNATTKHDYNLQIGT